MAPRRTLLEKAEEGSKLGMKFSNNILWGYKAVLARSLARPPARPKTGIASKWR